MRSLVFEGLTLQKIMRTFTLAIFLLTIVGHRVGIAAPDLPVYTLERFDEPIGSDAIDTNGRNTVVIYGDELDLARTNVYAIRPQRQRAQDFVIVARRLKLGPDTEFDLSGIVDAAAFHLLRGGDLYIAAESIELNGVTDEIVKSPVQIERQGGYHSMDAEQLRARPGRVFIFTNHVTLAEEYIGARVKELNISGATTGHVPTSVLKIISRGFSPANSIHRAVANDDKVLWKGLGDAYAKWIAEEPLGALLARELQLTLNSTVSRDTIDVVAPLTDAIKFIPATILAPWYVRYFQRSAGAAQAAIVRKDYGTAIDVVRNAKPFTATAPTAALASSEFTTAVATLQSSEQVLTQESIVEKLSFPIQGAAPLTVTLIRDVAASRISVMPNQILLDAVSDNGIFRVGFMRQEGDNVRVNMRGRLIADPSMLKLIRTKFPSQNSEIRVVEDDVAFDTLNLGLGGALVTGAAKILSGGVVEFDLLLSGMQFTQAMLKLAQPYGIDVTVNWRHQRLNLDNETTRINLSLARTEMSLFAKDGQLKNEFTHPIDIDYLLDGEQVRTTGYPIRLSAGQTIRVSCETLLCYAPGSAVRHQLPNNELLTWLISTTGASTVQQYIIENQLESDPALGGKFRSLVLEVSFEATSGATPQRTGSFILGPRGSPRARKTLSFLASTAGGGKLTISGRAYWGNGQSYHDIPPRTVESSINLIDLGWLKPTSTK